MKNYCANCGKAHNNEFQVDFRFDFCSRECWSAMNGDHRNTVELPKPANLKVAPKRPATCPTIRIKKVTVGGSPGTPSTEYSVVYPRTEYCIMPRHGFGMSCGVYNGKVRR